MLLSNINNLAITPINLLTIPTGNVSMNSLKIINLANGTQPNDAVNYS